MTAARALYRKPPDEKELSGLGLTRADFAADESIDIWPDNWLSFQVMCAMQTQWRVGTGGAYGLDYNVLPLVFRRCHVPRDKRDDVFDDLQEMESAALAEMKK